MEGKPLGWSPRRKCPFNQTSAKIPLPSRKRGRQHRQMDRLSRGRCKYIQECAAFSRNSTNKFGIAWKKMSFLLCRRIIILIKCRLLQLNGNFYLLTGFNNNLAIDPSEIPDFSFSSALQATRASPVHPSRRTTGAAISKNSEVSSDKYSLCQSGISSTRMSRPTL